MSIISVLKGFIEDLIGEKESDGWEYIGEIDALFDTKKGDIPPWIIRYIEDIYKKQSDPHNHTIPGSSLGLMDFYPEGGRSGYKLEFRGQGGSTVYIYKLKGIENDLTDYEKDY